MSQDIKNVQKTHHSIIMENRKKLTITGVSDIDSFNEQCVIAITSIGTLTIKGSELHVGKLNIESGDLNIDGHIDSLIYSNTADRKGGSVFKGLFK